VRVSKVTEKGLVVLVGDDVEGFIPVPHLGIEQMKDPADHFQEGDELEAKVLRVDSVNHRILLSVKAFLEGQETAALEEFQTKFGKRGQTVGEALKAGAGETDLATAGEAAETAAGEAAETAAAETPASEGDTASDDAEPKGADSEQGEEPVSGEADTAGDTEADTAGDKGGESPEEDEPKDRS
jgi:predicted RNA-binding protein with RPS1 domain